MSQEIRLFSYFRSSCSWRVRIALNLKGIAYETVPINLLDGAQGQPSYRQLNPQGLLPALQIDGVLLAESLAIIEYLDETRPEPPLLPEAPVDRARARRIAEAINAGIQPLQNLRVLLHLEHFLGTDKVAWAAHWIRLGFERLEQLLGQTAGRYAVGDAISIADLCLVPQVYNARRFGLTLSDYPRIAAIDERLSHHPAVQQAHPHRQPDTPESLRDA